MRTVRRAGVSGNAKPQRVAVLIDGTEGRPSTGGRLNAHFPFNVPRPAATPVARLFSSAPLILTRL